MEDGEEYFELRGAQVSGVARAVEDPAGVLEIGRAVTAGMAGAPDESLTEHLAQAARKRVGFVVESRRTTSWDHRKLLPER